MAPPMHWLQTKLCSVPAPRDLVGTRIKLCYKRTVGCGNTGKEKLDPFLMRALTKTTVTKREVD